jgi:hypothetical protein
MGRPDRELGQRDRRLPSNDHGAVRAALQQLHRQQQFGLEQLALLRVNVKGRGRRRREPTRCTAAATDSDTEEGLIPLLVCLERRCRWMGCIWLLL